MESKTNTAPLRPRDWADWSKDEREAYLRQQAAAVQLSDIYARVTDAVGGDLAHELLVAEGAVESGGQDRIRAKLKRFHPGVDDLIDLAFEVERAGDPDILVPTPEAEMPVPAVGIEPANLDERPATWEAWGPEEREAWFTVKEQYAAADTARDELETAIEALLGGPLREKNHALWSLVDHCCIAHRDLLAARLRRYLPQFADLIDFARGAPWMFPAGSPHDFGPEAVEP